MQDTYTDATCSVTSEIGLALPLLNCDGNGEHGGRIRLECVGGNFDPYSPTPAPTPVPTMTPTLGENETYVPTEEPTLSPTPTPEPTSDTLAPTSVSPTRAPTLVNTVTSGYLIHTNYGNSSYCNAANTTSWSKVIALDTCIPTLDLDHDYLSMRYSNYWLNTTTNSFTVTVETFSDPDCTTYTASTSCSDGNCEEVFSAKCESETLGSGKVAVKWDFSPTFPSVASTRVVYRYYSSASDCNAKHSSSTGIVFAKIFTGLGCLSGSPFGSSSGAAWISECGSKRLKLTLIYMFIILLF